MKKLLNQVKNIFLKIGHFIYHTEQVEKQPKRIVLFNVLKFRISNRGREALTGYGFIGIWIIGFFLLSAYPLVMSLVYSFNTVSFAPSGGIILTNNNFDNYVTSVSNLAFLEALQSFAYQILLYLPIILIISMIIAILLNTKIKLRGFFRSVYFLPVIIASGPLVATLLGTDARQGLLEMATEQEFGAFLTDMFPEFVTELMTDLFSHLVTILWFSGVQIILFLAGLQKINQEIYEAAQIDGASPWEMFWKITLPSLKNIILVSSIYTIVTLASFSTNEVLYVINQARGSSFGIASAMSWIYFVIVGLMLGIVTFLLTYEKKTKEKRMNVKKEARVNI